jgi:hypothetical protein
VANRRPLEFFTVKTLDRMLIRRQIVPPGNRVEIS